MGEEKRAANEAPAGILPRQTRVGSLWVSKETGAWPKEAPPISHRPRENFRLQRGPKQNRRVSAAPWPCWPWIRSSNALPLLSLLHRQS